MLHIRNRFTRQPQTVIELDRGHPLARGLIFSAYNSGRDFGRAPRDYVSGKIGALTGTTLATDNLNVGQTASPIVTHKYNGTSDFASFPINLSPYRRVTVTFLLYWDAYASGDHTPIVYGTNATTETGFYVDPDASGVITGSAFAANTFSRYTFPGPAAASWHHFTYAFDLDATQEFAAVAVDGVPQTITINTQNMSTGATFTNETLFLMKNSLGSAFGPGRMMCVNIYARYLGNAEAAMLYRYPWAMFKPPTRIFAVQPTAPAFAAHRFQLAC